MKKSILWVLPVLFFSVTMVQAQKNIYINQVGYLPGSPKHAYIDYEVDSFQVIDRATSEPVFSAGVNLKKENDPNSGMDMWIGDFSEVQEPGSYVIKVFSEYDSGITSFPFEISDTIYNELLHLANKSLYLQRCGLEMKPEHVGKHARPACHPNDANYHHTAEQKGNRDMTGGWHDAGDYGKYIAAGSVTANYLLLAYELNPEKHSCDAQGILESGNNVPDLIDEVKYEIDWMFKMQREDGAVHEKVHTKLYETFVMPHEAKSKRYIYEVTSTATADFVAIMARTSRIYATIDEAYSKKCLDAAVKSYEYLKKHPEIFPEGGFVNPPDTKAGGYYDAFDKDERIWAAAEMYVTTGKKSYHKDFLELNKELKSTFTEAGWSNPSTFAYYTYLLNDVEITSELKEELKKNLVAYCDKHIEIAANDGFGTAMLADDFVWGSNMVMLKKAINLIIGYELTGNEAYRNLAEHHMNSIMGVNPLKRSYVTGVGTFRVLNLHHAPSIAHMHAEPIPGILTEGPNKFLQDRALKNAFTKDTPPAKTYVDDVESYASNENTISGNSVLYFVASYINGKK